MWSLRQDGECAVMRISSSPDLVVGVDLGGSKISLSYWRMGELVRLQHCEEGKGLSRGYKLRDTVLDAFEWAGDSIPVLGRADYVFIEEPIVGRGVRASLQLSQMYGAFRAELAERARDNQVYDVPISVWKRATVGRGNAKKEDVANWLKEYNSDYYSRCDGNQDLIDATAIGYYGCGVVAQSGSLVLSGSPEQHDEPGAGSP